MRFLAAAAVFAAGAPVCIAQNVAANAASTAPAEPGYTQSQPAPIERAYPNQNPGPYGQYARPYGRYANRYGNNPAQPLPGPATLSPGGTVSATTMPLTAHPIPGVILRVAPNSAVNEVASTPERLELRVESGVANLNVHDPQKDVVVLVDLPGGQTQPLKNGLYTFNAATNTARVLKGEALAFPASAPSAKPMKIKQYNKIEFGKDARPHEFVPQQAIADLIPAPPRGPEQNGRDAGYGSGDGYRNGYGSGYGYGGYGYGNGYGYAPYGDGFYGYPYGYYPYYGFAGAYPWGGWGDPYGGFYPYGIGLGFGYYGGWGHYGGFHGGGFHGGGFRGHR